MVARTQFIKMKYDAEQLEAEGFARGVWGMKKNFPVGEVMGYLTVVDPTFHRLPIMRKGKKKFHQLWFPANLAFSVKDGSGEDMDMVIVNLSTKNTWAIVPMKVRFYDTDYPLRDEVYTSIETAFMALAMTATRKSKPVAQD